MTGGRFPRHRWNYCRTHAQSFTTECIGCRRAREASEKAQGASAMANGHTHRCAIEGCTERIACDGKPVSNGDCGVLCEREMDAIDSGRDTLGWLCEQHQDEADEAARQRQRDEDGPPDAEHELRDTSLDDYNRAWEQKRALR